MLQLKNSTKIALALLISLVVASIFNVSTVNAAEDTEYKTEKDGYIVYSKYFDNLDVSFPAEDLIFIRKTEIEQNTINEILEQIENGLEERILIPLEDDVTDIAIDEENVVESKITTIDGKKYADIKYTVTIGDKAQGDNEIYNVILFSSFSLQITNANGTTTRDITVEVDLRTVDFFEYKARVVNEKGAVYGEAGGTNGCIAGMGMQSLPKNLDVNKTYIEYLTNQYIGESINVDSIGTIPYAGKYGDYYKYKTSMKNAKFEDDSLNISLNYKNAMAYSSFGIDENYVVREEEYTSQEQTTKDNTMEISLEGSFNGTIKAEEVKKDDVIYSDVEDKLNEYVDDNIFMTIHNIYIEEGSFENSLKLTFDVGEQYNGKQYYVVHMLYEDNDYEMFEGIVKDGKIEIVVDSLSPFGIAITDVKDEEVVDTDTNTDTEAPTTNTSDKELDETPKTGENNIRNVICLTAIVLSVAGIAIIKKYIK